jgi:hypothetical protein
MVGGNDRQRPAVLEAFRSLGEAHISIEPCQAVAATTMSNDLPPRS